MTTLAVSDKCMIILMNNCPYPVVYKIEIWSIGRLWCLAAHTVAARNLSSCWWLLLSMMCVSVICLHLMHDNSDEWLSISCSLQEWDLVYWEAACLVWSPESCVTAARCSCACVVHWKVKVTSSLTDVWQQLCEQQDITVICTNHCHPWLPENHISAPAPGDTDWNQNAGTCLSETNEVCPWTEMASDWNMVSNQQSFIDQSVDQWRDCFIACLKANSTLNICYDVFLYDM